jgi:hypothetical protein
MIYVRKAALDTSRAGQRRHSCSRAYFRRGSQHLPAVLVAPPAGSGDGPVVVEAGPGGTFLPLFFLAPRKLQPSAGRCRTSAEPHHVNPRSRARRSRGAAPRPRSRGAERRRRCSSSSSSRSSSRSSRARLQVQFPADHHTSRLVNLRRPPRRSPPPMSAPRRRTSRPRRATTSRTTS